MAGQDCLFDPTGIEQRNDVGSEVLDAVAAIRLVGLSVPALRHGDRMYVAR